MIEARDLTLKINNRLILDNLSLSFNSGINTIIGPNGSGKSSFVKCLTGMIKDVEDRIFYFGECLKGIDFGKRSSIFSYLSQSDQPQLSFLVNELVEFACYKDELFPKELSNDDSEKFKDLCQIFDFKIEGNREISSLSGGELQKLLLICQLLQSSKCVILDEPFSALDPGQHYLVYENLRSYVQKNNLICIVISHDINSSFCYSDRVVSFKDGKVFFDLDRESFFNSLDDVNQLFGYEFSKSEGESNLIIGPALRGKYD